MAYVATAAEVIAQVENFKQAAGGVRKVANVAEDFAASLTHNKNKRLHQKVLTIQIAGEECAVNYWLTTRSLVHKLRHAEVTCSFGSAHHTDKKSCNVAQKRCEQELVVQKRETQFLEKFKDQLLDNNLQYTGELCDSYRMVMGALRPNSQQKLSYFNKLYSNNCQ